MVDWSQIPGDVFTHARTLAIVEDHSGIDALIRPNLHPLDTTEQQHPALTVEQVRSIERVQHSGERFGVSLADTNLNNLVAERLDPGTLNVRERHTLGGVGDVPESKRALSTLR